MPTPLVLPSLRFAMFGGGSATLVVGAAELSASGTTASQVQAQVALALPAVGVKALGGGFSRLTLPAFDLSVKATSTGRATATLQLTTAEVFASGTIKNGGSADLTFGVPASSFASERTYRMRAFGGANASLEVPLTLLSSTGTVVQRGAATLELPRISFTSEGTRLPTGSAALVLPAFTALSGVARMVVPGQFTLVSTGSSPPAGGSTYAGYSLNLRHTPRGRQEVTDELTAYSNFPFTAIVRFKDEYYASGPGGLFRIGGDSDNGAPIAFTVETHQTDFDTGNLKTVESLYVSGRLGEETTITLNAKEEEVRSYDYVTPRGATAQNHRQPLGRGVKANYFSFRLSGEGAIDIDALTPLVKTLTRRI